MSDTYPQSTNPNSTDPDKNDDLPSDVALPDDHDFNEQTDAPLVDMALQQVADHDNSLSATVGEDVEALRAEVESLKQRAGDMSGQLVSTAKASVDTTTRSARDFVRQSPLASLGIAVAIGFLAGIRARR